MNSISWFIYFAEVIGNLGFTLAAACIICVIVLVFGSLFNGIENENFWWAGWRIFGSIAVVCGVIGIFIPSKGTMYAIAASQIGERVAQNETVQGIASDATKALQIWIKKQSDPEKPAK